MIHSIHQIPIDKFINPESAKEFECTICARVMEHATDIGCGNGHLFCFDCLQKFYKHKEDQHSSSTTKCPLCQRQTEKSKIRKDCFVDRLIAKLHVTCPTTIHTTDIEHTTNINTNYNRSSMPPLETDTEDNSETESETDDIRVRPRRSKRLRNKRRTNNQSIYRSRSRSYSKSNRHLKKKSKSKNVSKNTNIKNVSENANIKNISLQCKWSGEYGNLKYHLSSHCLYWKVSCLYCQQYIIRKNLAQHKMICIERPIKPCTNTGCFIMCSVSKIANHMKNECQYRIVQCSNRGCNERFECRLKSEHKSVCSEEIVVCRYANVGCSHRIKRRLLDMHYSEKSGYHERLERRYNRDMRGQRHLRHLGISMDTISRLLFFSMFDEGQSDESDEEGEMDVNVGIGGRREVRLNFNFESGMVEDENGEEDGGLLHHFLFHH